MKLIDLFEQEKKEESLHDDIGLFVGYRINRQARQGFFFFSEDHQIPNPVPQDELHVTLIGSPTFDPEFTPEGILERPIAISNLTPDVWTTKDGKKCLVMRFESRELQQEYEYVTRTYNLKSEYEEFLPHITLSYDLEGREIDKKELGNMQVIVNSYVPVFDLVEQYAEPLRDEEEQ